MTALPSFLWHVERATPAVTVASVALRLLVAAALGGIIGIERQLKHRPAGLRTNMFICFGAALFTILSSLMSPGGEDTRIAAQIVSGIGFLGAGVIMRSGANVQGVTTAATIFVVAGIGMCSGSGLIFPAVLATALVWFGLFILGILENRVFGQIRFVQYQIDAPTSSDVSALLADTLKESRSRLAQMKINNQRDSVQAEFLLEARDETQQALQKKLRQELDADHLISFNITAQE